MVLIGFSWELHQVQIATSTFTIEICTKKLPSTWCFFPSVSVGGRIMALRSRCFKVVS